MNTILPRKYDVVVNVGLENIFVKLHHWTIFDAVDFQIIKRLNDDPVVVLIYKNIPWLVVTARSICLNDLSIVRMEQPSIKPQPTFTYGK